MVQERHPDVASLLVGQLAHPTTPRLQAVARVARDLTGLGGFQMPSWRELAMGARPGAPEPEHFEPGCTRDGWQHEVASRVEETFRAEDLFARMGDPGKALLRSQGEDQVQGLALSTCPVSRLTTFTPQLFRVVLLLRLHLPLPLTVRNCRCGRPLDSRGHHRAACARAGVLGGRGWAVENAAARTCREAGGRVTTNVMVRDLTWWDLTWKMPGDWKWSPMGSLPLAEFNSQSTPHWSVLFGATALPGEGWRSRMEWPPKQLACVR